MVYGCEHIKNSRGNVCVSLGRSTNIVGHQVCSKSMESYESTNNSNILGTKRGEPEYCQCFTHLCRSLVCATTVDTRRQSHMEKYSISLTRLRLYSKQLLNKGGRKPCKSGHLCSTVQFLLAYNSLQRNPLAKQYKYAERARIWLWTVLLALYLQLRTDWKNMMQDNVFGPEIQYCMEYGAAWVSTTE